MVRLFLLLLVAIWAASTFRDFLSDAIIVQDYPSTEDNAPSLYVSFVTGYFTPDELRRAFRFDFATD